MILAQYIQQLHLSPKVAIDLCAAPGGKSTLLRSFLPQKTILVSNEIEQKRSHRYCLRTSPGMVLMRPSSPQPRHGPKRGDWSTSRD